MGKDGVFLPISPPTPSNTEDSTSYDKTIDKCHWVINISNHQLSGSEQSLLKKGLIYNITPSKTDACSSY